MNIKILGPGCSKCVYLEKKVRELISKNNIEATVEKVTDLQEILKYGIMMTPALVVNEKVLCYGSIPRDNQILQWLKEAK